MLWIIINKWTHSTSEIPVDSRRLYINKLENISIYWGDFYQRWTWQSTKGLPWNKRSYLCCDLSGDILLYIIELINYTCNMVLYRQEVLIYFYLERIVRVLTHSEWTDNTLYTTS